MREQNYPTPFVSGITTTYTLTLSVDPFTMGALYVLQSLLDWMREDMRITT